MRRAGLMVVSVAFVGCHLADDIDPPRCPTGFHPELQKCVPDEVAAKRVVISAASGGTSCAGAPASQRPPIIEPATFSVRVGEEFQFENTDHVDHEVRGAAGDVWLTVGAEQLSAFTTMKKAGTFPYRVSGCETGATIVVEP